MRLPIYFIGAGPGDPELITLKGKRLIDNADLVIYTGSLIPDALIQGLKAEIHDSSGLRLSEIMDLMIAAWNDKKRIVRLHTGDPAIYGAIKEQMDALSMHRIPFEVVPGVSSITAASAALKAELTVPGVSQTVIITRLAGRTPVPQKERLESLAHHQATMMILLSAGMIDSVVKELMDGGYPGDTPVIVLEKVTWPEERIIMATLASISDKIRTLNIHKTAIIAVGKAFGAEAAGRRSMLYGEDFRHGCRE